MITPSFPVLPGLSTVIDWQAIVRQLVEANEAVIAAMTADSMTHSIEGTIIEATPKSIGAAVDLATAGRGLHEAWEVACPRGV